jgi:sirohydrochlorin cobaltochelatase
MLRLAELMASHLQPLEVRIREGRASSLGGEEPIGAAMFRSPLSALCPPVVETAVLELHPQPLHQQIAATAERAIAAGYQQLNVIPLFLLRGVHVMEDIPTEVAIAQRILGDRLNLRICPHLGSHPQVRTLLTLPPHRPSTATWVLVSHGSRRPGGNEPVEAIALDLGATVAYWSVEPKLDTQLAHLVRMGCREIVILPYFLFAGGITDAIAQMLQSVAHQYPYVRLDLREPIGDSERLAHLVLNLTEDQAV